MDKEQGTMRNCKQKPHIFPPKMVPGDHLKIKQKSTEKLEIRKIVWVNDYCMGWSAKKLKEIMKIIYLSIIYYHLPGQ